MPIFATTNALTETAAAANQEKIDLIINHNFVTDFFYKKVEKNGTHKANGFEKQSPV